MYMAPHCWAPEEGKQQALLRVRVRVRVTVRVRVMVRVGIK